MNFKKMLAAVGLLTVAVPTSLSVVACGTNDTIKLSDVIKNVTITVTAEDQVIDAVLKLNEDSGLTKTDLEIKAGSFKAPNYGTNGEVTISVKISKFTGEVKITITALPQTNISTLIAPVITKGITEEDKAFTEWLSVNSITDLNKTDVSLSDFKVATSDEEGNLTIEVKTANIKYTGTITISLPKADASTEN